jgi:hypothetical protein
MPLNPRAYTQPSEQSRKDAQTSKRAAAVALKVPGVGLPGAAAGADLGGSSKYSSENLLGRRGEGLDVNSSWTSDSRS